MPMLQYIYQANVCFVVVDQTILKNHLCTWFKISNKPMPPNYIRTCISQKAWIQSCLHTILGSLMVELNNIDTQV